MIFEKTCLECKTRYVGTSRCQRWCSVCSRERKRARDRNVPPNRHGLSEIEYETLKQLGCAVCGEPFRETPHVDHDHAHCDKKIGCKNCLMVLLFRSSNNRF